jgi:hypothetical protein
MNDIDAIRARLRHEPMSWHQRAMLSTVIAAAIRDGEVIAEFSAFVVEVPIMDHEAEFVVVSARHCIATSLMAGAVVYLRVPLEPAGIDPNHPPYVWQTVVVPTDGWAHDENTDVSVAPIRLERLPPSHFLLSWPRGSFIGGRPAVFGDDVIIFGRAALGDQGLVIRRRGALATHENPTVNLLVEPETYAGVRVFVVEANVTKGMSGGLVLWTTGGIGPNDNIALGVVHGYAYANRGVEESWAKDVADGNAEQAIMKAQTEIEAARNELVYVIPSDEIHGLVDDVARATAAAHGNPDPRVQQRLW